MWMLDKALSMIDEASDAIIEIGYILEIEIKEYEKALGINKYERYYINRPDGLNRYFMENVVKMLQMLPSHRVLEKFVKNIDHQLEHIDREYDKKEMILLYCLRVIRQEIESRNNEKERIGKKSMKKNFEGMFDGIMEKMMPRRVEDGEVAMTMNGGLAVKRADGDYVSYDPISGKIVNSMQFVINNDTIGKLIFLMPMAQLQAGDIIKNNKTYYYVREIYNGGVKVISLNSGAHSNIVEEQNIIFGTTMYSKVVSLFNMAGGQQATGGMFGQFNPMMLMALMDKSEDGDGNGMDFMEAMVMMQMFGNGQGMFGNMFNGLGGVQNQ